MCLALVVVGCGMVWVRGCSVLPPQANAGSALRSLTAPCGLAALVTATVSAALFGESAFDYKRCEIRGWLASCVLLSLCLAVAGLAYPARRSGRLAAALLAVLLSGMVVVLMPAKEHAFRTFEGTWLSPNLGVVLAAASVPLGSAALLLLSLRERGAPSGRPRWWAMAIGALAGMGWAGFAGSGVFSRDNPYLEGHLSDSPSVDYVRGATLASVAVVTAVFLVAWLLRPVSKNRLALAALALVILCFAATLQLTETVVRSSLYLTYHLPTLPLASRWSDWLPWLLMGAAAMGLLADAAAESRSRRWIRPAAGYLLAAAAILLGIGHFVRVNYWRGESLQLVRAIVALDGHTGRPIWTCEGLAGPLESLDRHNSPASPTPVIAGDRIVAYFGQAGLMACDRAGRLAWSQTGLPFASTYGAGSSPIAAGGVVVLAADGQPELDGKCRVWAFALSDGERIWSHEAKPSGLGSGNCRTPIVWNPPSGPVVLLWGAGVFKALRLETGEVVWQQDIPSLATDLVSSPVVDQGIAYLSEAGGTRAIDLAQCETSDDPVLWLYKAGGTNCVTPLVDGGLLFLVTDGGVATCLDAKTGQPQWKKRLPGQYFASPVSNGRNVYFVNTDGCTTVVRQARKYELLAQNTLDEPAYASLAGTAGKLYLRGFRSVYCLENRRPAGAAALAEAN